MPIQSCSLLYFWSTFIIINVNKTSSTIFWCAGRLVTCKKPKRGFKARFASLWFSHRNPFWIKWFAKRAWRAPFWIKWLAKRALKPRLNQMTRETRFEAPFWIKWLAKRALNPRSEPMTRETRFEAPFWIKWLAKRALKSPFWNKWLAKRALKPQTEPIDSRNVLWSPQLTRETRSEVPNWTKWFELCALKSRI